MQELMRIYSEVSYKYLDEDFDWADLGSFGSADAYLWPLSSLRGRCLCIEGREDSKDASNMYKNNPYINSRVESVNCFVSGQKEQRYFFESAEGGGSTFYPNQDLISQVLEGSSDKLLNRKLVNCESLEYILSSKELNCVYVKADLEGAEFESLKSIIDGPKIQKPLILEVEINIGERGPFRSIGDGLREYEIMGYRLVDMRKTYFYPKGDLLGKDTINDDPIFAPHFQGCLYQADLLLIDTECLSMTYKLSKHNLLSLCLILMLYRQFHLAAKLLETRNEVWAKEMTSEVLPRVINEFRKIAINNESALWGYHPLFNWLKST